MAWKIFLIICILIKIVTPTVGDEDKDGVVALVLARGGSKGIPLKNLAKLDNKSLLQRSLEAIYSADVFKEVWVSTDHQVIAMEAKMYNASIHIRPEEYSRDETSSLHSVQEFLHRHPEINKLALIQCTSPFQRSEYLRKGVEDFVTNSECVFSVRRSYEFRWSEEKGQIIPVNLNPALRPRRQDWSGELVENGMFYMARRKLIMDLNTFQSNSCRVVHVKAEDSLQIDTPFDLALAESILELQKKIPF